MTHAMELHDNYHLFGAHKYYVWLFEEALRNECGYTGYQPVREPPPALWAQCDTAIDNVIVHELRSLQRRSMELPLVERQRI